MQAQTTQYDTETIVRSFKWLGHMGHGWTELIAFHRNYEPNKEHWQENLEKKRLPKIWYTRNAKAAVKFVERFHQEHMCCFGVNPRPSVLKNERGYPRSAKDSDIKTVMNFYLDIDCLSKDPDKEQLAELGLFLIKAEGYFEDLGINIPVTAFSGRGYHLLFSPTPIQMAKHSDTKEKLNQFRRLFISEFERDLEGLGARVDSTMDLKRVAKIYGTKKPGRNRISEFRGGARVKDKRLTIYLLRMSIAREPIAGMTLPVGGVMPERFRYLLQRDKRLRNLWQGIGKKEGDISSSGYDFSIVRYCLKRGITDLVDLATILSLRPGGCVKAGRKGEQYIKHTIANAIRK